MKPWVRLGKIVAAHGIKGQVKIKTFTENPENLTSYGDLVDGNQNPVKIVSFSKKSEDILIAAVAGVTSRNQAELLKGVELFVHQSQLPALSETEVYHESLLGLRLLADGKKLGEVISVYDFGAGAFCEIQTRTKVGTIHLTSCTVFSDHLECDEHNFLI